MLRRRIPSANSLFTFEAVARLASFSDAANELNVTQPAISRSINGLETHLGYPLFERHGRWIKLTQNGDKLFRATSTAFNTISSSMMEIERRKDNLESVTISMSPSAVNYWFIPRMRQFKQKFPAISLNFHDYGKADDGLPSNVDLGIRLSNPLEPDMHRWPFADEEIIALCSPEYISTHGPLDQLNSKFDHNRQNTHTFVEWVDQRFGLDEFLKATGLKIPENASFTKFSDYSSILQAAIQGQGIALAWITEASKQLLDGKLVPACAQVVKTGRRYHVLASNLTPMRPAVEDVRDWLINQMRSDRKKLQNLFKAERALDNAESVR
ncbi:MAG: LysR family transcriptional regulator [Hyphomicrobiales bacterium]|nr:LysR family transcriptional regulator [Hyphomicrobiales bacterium]